MSVIDIRVKVNKVKGKAFVITGNTRNDQRLSRSVENVDSRAVVVSASI